MKIRENINYFIAIAITIALGCMTGTILAQQPPVLRNVTMRTERIDAIHGGKSFILYTDPDLNGSFGVYQRVILNRHPAANNPSRYVEFGWVKLSTDNFQMLMAYGTPGTADDNRFYNTFAAGDYVYMIMYNNVQNNQFHTVGVQSINACDICYYTVDVVLKSDSGLGKADQMLVGGEVVTYEPPTGGWGDMVGKPPLFNYVVGTQYSFPKWWKLKNDGSYIWKVWSDWSIYNTDAKYTMSIYNDPIFFTCKIKPALYCP